MRGGSMAEHGLDHGLDARHAGQIGLPAIFAAFFWLGITSFGGGTAGWLYREIIERRHWITDAEFLSAAGLSHIMPGSGGVKSDRAGRLTPARRARRGGGSARTVVGAAGD